MLECAGLTKTYPTERGEIEAIRDIDLVIPAGEFAAVVGRSGSGKSSLMAAIGGLSRPSGGTVELDDVDVWSLPNREIARFRNRRIGFVFQFASLLPALRIVDNVALPGLLRGHLAPRVAYQAAWDLLVGFGLGHCLDAYPQEVSAGEQRRAAIARALVNAPPLLLADEPTSDLDEQTEIEIIDELRRLNRERRMTVVMVTHNLRLAEVADRVIHIAGGRLVR